MKRFLCLCLALMSVMALTAGCNKTESEDVNDTESTSEAGSTETNDGEVDFELEPMDDPSFGEEAPPSDGNDLLLDVPDLSEEPVVEPEPEPETIPVPEPTPETEPETVPVPEPAPVTEAQNVTEEVPLAGTGIYD